MDETCIGMKYQFWVPYWRDKYGTKPLTKAIQAELDKILGREMQKATRQEIHEALRKLGYGQLILE